MRGGGGKDGVPGLVKVRADLKRAQRHCNQVAGETRAQGHQVRCVQGFLYRWVG